MLRISPSQLETFELCPRKWWFLKKLRLPTRQQKGASFGTVLHGVIERYLTADKTGRVPQVDDDSHPLAGQAGLRDQVQGFVPQGCMQLVPQPGPEQHIVHQRQPG